MTTATRSAGLTGRQASYLGTLIDGIDALAPGTEALPLIRDRVPEMTKREASNMIDELKAILNGLRRDERERKFATPDLEPGFYLHEDVVYEVIRSQNDRLYANVLDTERGQFVRAKGAIYKLSAAGSQPLTLQEAAGISRRLKRCIVCGHKLKRLESQERGIGPVCAKRFG